MRHLYSIFGKCSSKICSFKQSHYPVLLSIYNIVFSSLKIIFGNTGISLITIHTILLTNLQTIQPTTRLEMTYYIFHFKRYYIVSFLKYLTEFNRLISSSNSERCDGIGRGALAFTTLCSLFNKMYLGIDFILKYSAKGDFPE